MFKLNEINNYEEKKKAAQPQQTASPAPSMDAPLTDTRDNITPLAKPFQQMATDAASKPIPKIDNFDMDEVQKNARSQYIQSFDKWSDAEKDGTFSQQEWANKRIEKMVAEGQNPGEYLNVLSLLGDTETPAEKAKREKREALGETFRNLGSLIGSAANLYYTNKGGQYIDLNSVNEKHRERMQRLKDKQDALDEKRKNIIINAKLGDLKNDRLEAIRKEQERKADAIRKEDKAYRDARDKQNQENWTKQFEWNVEQAKHNADERAEEKEYRRKQDKENLAYKWAELNYRKENASKGGKSSKYGNKIVVDTLKGVMDVDFDKMNEATIAQMYQKLSEDIRKKYDVSGLDNKNERIQLMNEAIGEGLITQEGYSDWLEKAGIGRYQGQQGTNWNDYLYTPNDWSGYKQPVQSNNVVNNINEAKTSEQKNK